VQLAGPERSAGGRKAIVALLAAAALCTPAPMRGDSGKEETQGGPSLRVSLDMAGYSDTDAVRVASPSVAATVADDVAGWSLSGRYLVDAVSAASVDVISTASSRWFEYRHVGSGAASFKAGELTVSLSGGLSREPDYLSVGGGVTIALDLLEKNFTPFLGLSYGHDSVGRTGMPHDLWQDFDRPAFQTGATIVVDRATILNVAIDGIFERGYLAKPYRYVPLFAPGVGSSLPEGASVELVNQRRLDMRPADALPDARDRFALSGKLAHRFDAPVTLRIEERGYRDSWGLLASTTDARVTVDASRRLMLWPHARLHAQRQIDFWQRAYEAPAGPDGTLGVPRYRTGDRELGPLTTWTLGGGLRWQVTSGLHNPWTLSLQWEEIFTHFKDALYVTRRRAHFAVVSLAAEIN
jgi:hypothetical protein